VNSYVHFNDIPFAGDCSLAKVEALQQDQDTANGQLMDGRVINRDVVLSHSPLKFPRAQILSQIPADTQQDHRLIKMTAFEQYKPPKFAGGMERTRLLMDLQ
jgi:hypothetical protein